MEPSLFSFVPGWSHLVPFLLAGLALNLTPGADMTYVLSRSLAQGKAAGLASALGIFTGSAVHSLLAAAGVAALIAASEIGYSVLTWVGAAYLVYLAVRLWREDTSLEALQNRRPA
ncbi:MAG TPA: LysE family transporter, partial [Kiloniellales bacterium]|nr:LysE family transporter [Kiloniellales bacterium]